MLFFQTFTLLGSEDWQKDYSVSIGTSALAADPAAAELGDDCYKLGTVKVPAATSALTVQYHGSGAAADVVWLVEEGAAPRPISTDPTDLDNR